MENTKISSEDRWLEYISKLNDREINRRRSSGFTLWAVSGFIALLIYRMLDSIPVLISLNNISLLELTFATVINISCAICIFVIMLLFHGTDITDIRLSSKIDKSTKPIFFIPLVLLGIFVAIVNIHVGYTIRITGVEYRIYYIFGIFYLIQIATPILQKIIQYVKFRKAYKDMPLLDAPPILFSPKAKVGAQISITILSGLFLLFSIIQVYQVLQHSNILTNNIYIKISLEFTVLLYMIVYLFIRLVRSVRHDFLTKLERKIVIENIESKDIAKMFAVEYLGETMRDWIRKTESKINDLYVKFNNATDKSLRDIDGIKNIDKKYSFEIEGRIKNMCKEYKIIRDEYLNYLDNTLKHISYLGTDKALVTDNDLVKEVMKSWKIQIDEVKKSFNAVCDACKAVGVENGCKKDKLTS